MSKLNGIINVLKPPGITSFQVVSRVKKFLNVKKAGHTGTLDPAAAGVLPVCLGKATKIIPFIPEDEKVYTAEITLGTSTDTLDAEGKIIDINDRWKLLDETQLSEVLGCFLGKIKQVPPMYSAVHHQGKRLYELARQGKKVDREARDVVIKDINLIEVRLPVIRMRVRCSRGTYIRSLARDIGESLNTGAHLSFLIRESSGPFVIKEANTLQDIKNKATSLILPLDYPLHYPALILCDSSVKKACNGAWLSEKDFSGFDEDISADQRVLIYDQEGNFISVNKVISIGDKVFNCKPLRVFV
ncbi:tRNA pseudouridine(55) synthase TruB [Halocella sp. SP3-1]|uniref:tRNA pseudouridine(55) synthase TruB n=1 Tax=Halocella sp. SP3-1 TaxID=2382161 RepID=UPI000F7604E1|nr:tRNA pseudouridine(55) synthase TruB [Halocella sp. SP3-1]AZO95537.1 tRNA pseudouridine(55) synthase TruB [Halocella sp. SP3-1]